MAKMVSRKKKKKKIKEENLEKGENAVHEKIILKEILRKYSKKKISC